MSILYVLIPLGLLLLVAAIWAFFWAVESGQFDDLDSAGSMILFDDETAQVSTGSSPRPSSGGEARAATVSVHASNVLGGGATAPQERP